MVLRFVSSFAAFALALFSGLSAAGPLDSLAPGHWYRIPHSKLIRAAPHPAPPGIIGPRAVVDAWSGGAFDSLAERMIIWGGGHADYSGNEVYAFDLSTLKWSRLTDPSSDVGGDIKTGLYPDGKPRSAHSYNSLQYDPKINCLLVMGLAATYRTSGNSYRVFTFNLKTRDWDHDFPKIPRLAGHTLSAITAYDPATGKIWYHGSSEGRLYAYDPEKHSWAGPYGKQFLSIYATAAIDPERHLLVAVGGYGKRPQAFAWNLGDPGRPLNLIPRSTGDKRLERVAAPGFVYDSKIGKFVGWHGGPDVYVLDPGTWHWEKISPASPDAMAPGKPNRTGTYGRFRYVASKDLFILVNAASQDVYVYRLPSTVR